MRAIFQGSGPFQLPNVRLYAWFTVLYNARAYYPIFAILFLDLGLSREEFLTLNAIWAAAIFLLEVPSGALADTIGRRKLLIAAAVMMILEMALLLFAPRHGGWVLLTMAVGNRLLSGASEAAASGADQALAYDTLRAAGEEKRWDEVLANIMAFRSAAFFTAMILGSLLYDPSLLARVLPFVAEWDKSLTLRLPLALVFLQGVACLVLALRLREIQAGDQPTPSLRQAFRTTLSAGRWVLTTPLALMVVLGGVLADAFARTFATLTSDYFRFISVPEWLFGFLGATFAVVGILIPKLARTLSQHVTPRTHLLLIATWAAGSLFLLGQAWPWWGILPAISTMAVLTWTDFLTSRELNRLADSSQRATILSVKGLIFNLGYGVASLGFATAVAGFEEGGHEEGAAFQLTLSTQPWLLLAGLLAFFLWSRSIEQGQETR
ncbi:MFS transporter [Roseibacillus ishigakijimensis]|uniref:MFS transporter n=1 Tax=Roseibacillus ishigakijimensis TaxID=454146 RepID=A0A934VIQ1_9BACT|nr:MFS transporter [Roseibacillus ishigakijimensis]MBK1835308.1 MFS transporter [Roseibacillus ishigakijimensis]